MKVSLFTLLVSTNAVELSRHLQDEMNLMSSSQLNLVLNQKADMENRVQSFGETIADVNTNIDKLEGIISNADIGANPDWQSQTTEKIEKLQAPVHGIITSWENWYDSNNALGIAPKYDPENNITQGIRSQIQDTYKAMRRIRGLENKLKSSPAGDSSNDWNLLLNLKREVGISNEFGDLEASTAGPGAESAKAVAANM